MGYREFSVNILHGWEQRIEMQLEIQGPKLERQMDPNRRRKVSLPPMHILQSTLASLLTSNI